MLSLKTGSLKKAAFLLVFSGCLFLHGKYFQAAYSCMENAFRLPVLAWEKCFRLPVLAWKKFSGCLFLHGKNVSGCLFLHGKCFQAACSCMKNAFRLPVLAWGNADKNKPRHWAWCFSLIRYCFCFGQQRHCLMTLFFCLFLMTAICKNLR